MGTLYNLLDSDGNVEGLIESKLDSATIEKLWETYYKSEEKNEADDEGSAVEVFLEQIKEQDPEAIQLWIENIRP